MGFEILAVIPFILIYFLVVAFFGLLALIVKNWLIIILAALVYWLFHKSLHKHIRKLWKKKIYTVSMIILSVLLLGVIIIVGIYSSMTRFSARVYSPDKKYYVQTMEVNGGATTAYQTSVSISDATYIFNNLGIISHRTENAETVLFFSGDVESAKPEWIDNHTLMIRYDCAKLYDQPLKQWRDIKIIYEKECE
jgi:hypothetical protein